LAPDVHYRIGPRLGACWWWGARSVFWLSVVVIALISAEHWWRDRRLPPALSESLLGLVSFIALAPLALGLFVFLIGRVCAATATRDGLVGASLWGKPDIVSWSSIERVVPRVFHGLPSLLVRSSASRKAIVIFTIGLDRKEIFTRLAELAGAEHILTRYFTSDST